MLSECSEYDDCLWILVAKERHRMTVRMNMGSLYINYLCQGGLRFPSASSYLYFLWCPVLDYDHLFGDS